MGGEHVGDIGDRHRGDQHHLPARTGDGHVQAPLAALLPEHAEAAAEGALAVTAEGGGEDDDVAFVTLDVFHVLDEHRHVLAVLQALALLGVGLAEQLVFLGTSFEMFLDQVGLLAVEGDDADGGALFVGLTPQLGKMLDDPLGFQGIALVLVQPVDLISSSGLIRRILAWGWRTGTLRRLP